MQCRLQDFIGEEGGGGGGGGGGVSNLWSNNLALHFTCLLKFHLVGDIVVFRLLLN